MQWDFAEMVICRRRQKKGEKHQNLAAVVNDVHVVEIAALKGGAR